MKLKQAGVALAAAAVLVAGCASPEAGYLRATSGVFESRDQALLVGEGTCELLEQGATLDEVDRALASLLYNGEERRVIMNAVDDYLCPDEGYKGEN